MPVYPSYPAIPPEGMTPAVRFAHVEALAERGLIDFAVIDPGSVNFTMTTATATTKPAFTYLNPEAPMSATRSPSRRATYTPPSRATSRASPAPVPRSPGWPG